MAKGTLYIISTPIGNLADISFRALDTLKKCNLILSEDTRETAKIFNKYQILVPQISYRDQNHNRVYPEILRHLNLGEDVALVSDSGTPLISDPGFKLVRKVIEENISVTGIPGPSAVISALVVSGLPTDKFSFLGFLPRNNNQIKKLLVDFGKLDSTLVIYESPMRLVKLLNHILESLGDRTVCVAGDMTKVYEKYFRGKVSEVIKELNDKKQKGEYVVLIAKEGY